MIGVGKNESCDVCLEGVHALSKDIQRSEVINRTVDFLLGMFTITLVEIRSIYD